MPQPGINLIYENPEFVDPENFDFKYLSNSPCIDSGNPNLFDSDGSTRDIGANIYINYITGDCNQDSTLSILDIVFMINNCVLNNSLGCECSDMNIDGVTNVLDVVNLINLILEN